MMEANFDSLSIEKVSIHRDKDSEKAKHRRRLIRTFFDGIVVLFLGMQASQKGPSFLDLQLISGTTLEKASTYFTASSFGYMAGSVVAGFIYDRIGNKVILICVPLTLASFLIGLTPWCTSYTTMLLVHIAASTQCGLPETSLTADVLRRWHGNSDPAVQFLSFSYSLGGVISPLYTEPFLAPVVNKTDLSIQEQSQSKDLTISPYVTSAHPVNQSIYTSLDFRNQSSNVPDYQHESELHYAFLITGILGFLIVLPFYFLSFRNCFQGTSQKGKHENPERIQKRLEFKPYIFLMTIVSAFIFLYTMTEDSFNMFLSMFVVSHLSWSKANGALITSLYWGIGTISKLIVTLLSRWLDMGHIMMFSCLGMVLSLTAFVIASHFHLGTVIWISTSFFAMSQASVFGGCFSWVDSNIMKMDGKVTSVCMIFASLGSMAGPLVLGITIKKFSLMVFPYFKLIESVINCILFIFMLFLLKPFVSSHYGSPMQCFDIEIEIENEIEITGEKKRMVSESDVVIISSGENDLPLMKDSSLS